MKLVWDNGRQVPPANNTQSHSRWYVPSAGSMSDTEDRFIRHYRHVFSMGVLNMEAPNMKQWCKEHRGEQLVQKFLQELGIDPQ